MSDRFLRERERMVERQLARRGISDERVLDAFRRVPREAFVRTELAKYAYDDSPLPIGEGQTISQPYVVALMTEAARVKPGARVLDVGTGSGYAAAILAELAGEVVTIERHAALADAARETLKRLGYANAEVVEGDGSRGFLARAPYDAILVAAGAPAAPRSLKEQLAEGGRLVIPITANEHQDLLVITCRGENYEEENLGGVRFVPLLGEEGWR
ncbi:MAG: protein-L-isoaspartate(D-aspartate) O-methyltransferase [Propylenella sp.]